MLPPRENFTGYPILMDPKIFLGAVVIIILE